MVSRLCSVKVTGQKIWLLFQDTLPQPQPPNIALAAFRLKRSSTSKHQAPPKLRTDRAIDQPHSSPNLDITIPITIHTAQSHDFTGNIQDGERGKISLTLPARTVELYFVIRSVLLFRIVISPFTDAFPQTA